MDTATRHPEIRHITDRGERLTRPEALDALGQAAGLPVEFRQLEPGGLDFRVQHATTGPARSLVMLASDGRTEVFGRAPHGAFSIVLPLGEPGLTLNGWAAQADEAFVLAPREAIECTLGAGAGLALVFLPALPVWDAVAKHLSVGAGETFRGTMLVTADDVRAPGLVEDMARSAGRPDDADAHPPLDRDIENIAAAIARSQRAPERPDADKRRRFRVVALARDYIDAHLGETIGMAALSAAAGVGVRTVERAFLAAVGVPPVVYIKARRLNAVRRALIDADADETSVATIARAHGFNHLGRFAGEYRRFFAEKPSATLRRADG